MKKLKCKLERRICDILSAVALWCEGKGCFRASTLYRFPLSDLYYVEVTKLGTVEFEYRVKLREKDYGDLMETTLRYDIFRRDVPMQKAYSIVRIDVLHSIDNIPALKTLKTKLYEAARKKG